MSKPRSYLSPLSLLLIGTVLLRLALCLMGGQRFWIDEIRYERAFAVLSDLRIYGIGSGLRTLFSHVDHMGFTGLSVPLVFVQVQLNRRLAIPVASTYWLASFLISLSSIGVILLTHRIALMLKASPREALYSALFVSASSVLFYFSRHLVPYDLALLFLLCFTACGLADECPWKVGLLAGGFAVLTFLTYNGNWVYLGAIGAACLARDLSADRFAWKKYAAFLLVWVGSFLLLEGLFHRLLHHGFLSALGQFSTTVVQGDAHEGWSLGFAYFWQAEGLLSLLWLASVLALPFVLRTADKETRVRSLFLLGVIFISYGALVLFANGLGKFVVYARSLRPFIPFFAMAVAFWLARLEADTRLRRMVPLFLGVCAVITLLHFYSAFRLTYPDDFERAARSRNLPFGLFTTIATPDSAPHGGACAPGSPWLLVNAQRHFYPPQGLIPLPAGRSEFTKPHPLAFIPYQYEGYSPEERKILRAGDLAMRWHKVDLCPAN